MSAAEPVHGTAPLLVASNRGPLSIRADGEHGDEVTRGGGGLVSGMQSALAASTDAVWVCAALNDRERVLARQDGRLSGHPQAAEVLGGDFDVRMLPIDALTFRQAYNGVANATLWFVLHMLYDTPRGPVFDHAWRRQWGAYVRYNQAFADALAAEAAEGATVMIQDYHLFLAPALLRERRPDVRIGHFTHTPWVSPDYFRLLPDDVARAVLDGLQACDLLGFHTRRWAGLFAECCREILGHEPRAALAPFPLGVSAEELTQRAGQPDVQRAVRDLADSVGECAVIGRVDRTELSKNVLRGLLAYRELLRLYPEWRGRVVHAVWDYPSREDLPAYRAYTAELGRLAEEIDEEFGTEDWTPLRFEIGDDYPGALAALRRSDVVFVNSVRDGMNLVVLEGIVLSERGPAVVLSRETGAADLLGDDAILVNPFDVEATATGLHEALTMDYGRRLERAARMRAAAVGLPPDAWFAAQLDAVRR